jgi:hypothetical protein
MYQLSTYQASLNDYERSLLTNCNAIAIRGSYTYSLILAGSSGYGSATTESYGGYNEYTSAADTDGGCPPYPKHQGDGQTLKPRPPPQQLCSGDSQGTETEEE